MYDRPSSAELIDAVRIHLEQNVIPVARETNRRLYFQTLVAINVLKIVERELDLGSGHAVAEWARLNAILGDSPLPDMGESLSDALTERNTRLCEAIRAGDYDDDQTVFEHLKASAIAQLEVANPKFLEILAAEDADSTS